MKSNKPQKIVVAINIEEDNFKLAQKYINDPDTMFNSFSQYVNYAVRELNRIQRKTLKLIKENEV